MTIPDLLTRTGHPLGARGRTTCPIHGGDNASEFSYTETHFCCFACGAKGGILSLLILLRTDEFDGLQDGLQSALRVPQARQTWTEKPSRRLLARLAERRQATQDLASALHLNAELWLREARSLLNVVGQSTESEDGRGWAFERAAGILDAAQALQDLTDELLDCDCRGLGSAVQTEPASLRRPATIALWHLCRVVEWGGGMAWAEEVVTTSTAPDVRSGSGGS